MTVRNELRIIRPPIHFVLLARPRGVLRRRGYDPATGAGWFVRQLRAKFNPVLIEDCPVEAGLGPDFYDRLFDRANRGLEPIAHL